MFNNLIESSLHTREFRRRGSFLLFTTAAYAVLFAIAGVASIYAYDAHLYEESTELALISWVPLDPMKPVAEPHRSPSASPKNSAQIKHSVRPEFIDTVNPNDVPKTTAIMASPIPPARPDSLIGSEILDPPGGGPSGHGDRSGPPNGTGAMAVVPDLGTPPPAPKAPPRQIVPTSKVLNGQAIYLPKPVYSQMAKQVRASGVVIVQILIDETGKVVSAHAVSGHSVLLSEAVKAAYQARFSPTILGDQPVKVSGVINYNFLLQ
jgi:TonB family protein